MNFQLSIIISTLEIFIYIIKIDNILVCILCKYICIYITKIKNKIYYTNRYFRVKIISNKNLKLEDINNQPDSDLNVKKYSLWILISFQFGQLVSNMFAYTFTAQMQYYYEKIVLLQIGLFTLAFIIYTIWNMFNDPVIGYLCDSSTRLTKRWGKRFPFIVIFGIPWCISFMFLFMAPSTEKYGQLIVFFWLLTMICVFDTLASGWQINHMSLFPDKFRDDIQRKQSGSIFAILSTIGLMLGAIIPGIVVSMFDTKLGYVLMALVLGLIGLIFMIGSIPGSRENIEIRERRTLLDTQERTQFFRSMRTVLKQRNFRAYLIYSLLYSAFYAIGVASIPFWVDDMLGLPKIMEIFLMLGLIISQPLTAPFWYKLTLKIGSRKVLVIGTLMAGLGLIPLIFVSRGSVGIILTMISMILVGIGGGGRLVAAFPIWSDIIDEATVINQERQEGLYQGINTFFYRLAIAIQVIIFFIIHTLSGYDPEAQQQSEIALVGLKIQAAIIPMLILISAALIFWIIYDLTPEKVNNLKIQLNQIKL